MASSPEAAAAAAAFSRGDFAAAEQMYAALLLRLMTSKPKPEPSELSSLTVNRANCLLRLSRATDAELACRHALRLQPANNINAHKILAAALHRMVKDGQLWRIHDEVTFSGKHVPEVTLRMLLCCFFKFLCDSSHACCTAVLMPGGSAGASVRRNPYG
jgi:hypothetical protein